jgi:ribosomal protein S3
MKMERRNIPKSWYEQHVDITWRKTQKKYGNVGIENWIY